MGKIICENCHKYLFDEYFNPYERKRFGTTYEVGADDYDGSYIYTSDGRFLCKNCYENEVCLKKHTWNIPGHFGENQLIG